MVEQQPPNSEYNSSCNLKLLYLADMQLGCYLWQSLPCPQGFNGQYGLVHSQPFEAQPHSRHQLRLTNTGICSAVFTVGRILCTVQYIEVLQV